MKNNAKPKKSASKGKRNRVTPEKAFRTARTYWLKGKRISIAELANDMGLSRITLYRWFGNRDQLIEDILWSMAGPNFKQCIRETPGTGVDHIVNVHRNFLIGIARFEPMRRYIEENPFAILRSHTTSDIKTSHGRHIRAVEAHLLEQERLGHITLPISAFKLAETIVYTNASLLYSAIIGHHSLSVIELACAIDRMLLMGDIPEDPTIF